MTPEHSEKSLLQAFRQSSISRDRSGIFVLTFRSRCVAANLRGASLGDMVMRDPLQRTLLVMGCCLLGGPVFSQDRPVVPPPILNTDYQRPSMLPGVTMSSPGAPLKMESQPGEHGEAHGIKDVTPSYIPGRSEPVHSEHAEGGWMKHGGEATGGGWYAFGDLLIMRPRRPATDFAIVDGANDLVPRGRPSSVLYNTEAGFRVGGGYALENGWSVGGTYTYFRNSDQRGLVAPPNGLIYPTLTRPGLIDSVTQANANLRLEYNVFDIDAMKKICVDESFAMKWGAGFKFVSIKQDLLAGYNGRDANNARVRSLNDFYGAGPTFGGEAQWNMMNGFGAYGKASGGLLDRKSVV